MHTHKHRLARHATGLTAIAAVAALGLWATAAQAGALATRCSEDGCVHIRCTNHGNRCYRFGGDRYYRHYGRYDGDWHYRHRGYRYGDFRYDGYRDDGYRYGGYRYADERERSGWRYDCDHDADRCYVRRHRDGSWRYDPE